MSHIPLLARQSVPKLQSPRRGPQLVLLCLVVTAVFLLVPQSAYPVLSWNGTHAAHEEAPPAVRRIVQAAKEHRMLTAETMDDLLTTVGNLAQREFGFR